MLKPFHFSVPSAFAESIDNAGSSVKESAFNATAQANATASNFISHSDSNATALFNSGDFGWSGYFQAVGTIFFILGGLILAFYLLKRFGPKTGFRVFGHDSLSLEGRLSLGPKKSLVVVRFLNKRLLIGVTDNAINLLSETETTHDDASPSFSEELDKAGRDTDSP